MNPIILEGVVRALTEERLASLKQAHFASQVSSGDAQIWRKLAWRFGDWMIRLGLSLQSMTSDLRKRSSETESESVIV